MSHLEYSLTSCVVCSTENLESLLELPAVPTHCNVLWPTHNDAINAPRGDIRLVFCPACGHVFNAAFQPELMTYTQAYENSLHFSSRFQSYVEELASRLIEQYNLREKDIIEIGCGQGDFLALLCQLGQNRGVGFDPSYIPENKVGDSKPQITFIQDFYSKKYATFPADLIACRHVLEHIQQPAEFLATIRQAIGNQLDTITFFEVPNALFTLRDLAIWDIIYEHCSYYSPNSLERLFVRCGFKVINVVETFEGQYLCLEAMAANKQDKKYGQGGEEMASYIRAFVNSYNDKMRAWQETLANMARTGRSGVIWGTGSKGVTFLNALDSQGCIEYAIDINPRKEGKFVPGSGQQIKLPEFLQAYQPDVVIVMNPIYADEIQRTMKQLQVTAQILIAT